MQNGLRSEIGRLVSQTKNELMIYLICPEKCIDFARKIKNNVEFLKTAQSIVKYAIIIYVIYKVYVRIKGI